MEYAGAWRNQKDGVNETYHEKVHDDARAKMLAKERATQHVNLTDENEMTEGLDEFLGQLLVLRCLVEDQITLV